jgi:hypothetical protein
MVRDKKAGGSRKEARGMEATRERDREQDGKGEATTCYRIPPLPLHPEHNHWYLLPAPLLSHLHDHEGQAGRELFAQAADLCVPGLGGPSKGAHAAVPSQREGRGKREGQEEERRGQRAEPVQP